MHQRFFNAAGPEIVFSFGLFYRHIEKFMLFRIAHYFGLRAYDSFHCCHNLKKTHIFFHSKVYNIIRLINLHAG